LLRSVDKKVVSVFVRFRAAGVLEVLKSSTTMVHFLERRRKKSANLASILPVGRAFLHSRSSLLLTIWLSFFLFFLFKKLSRF
jgi:hypothetical protein